MKRLAVVVLAVFASTACWDQVLQPPEPRRPLFSNGSLGSAADVSVETIELPGLGGRHSLPQGINEVGQAFGNATTSAGQYHAVLWTDGAITDLGAPPPGPNVSAKAINDRGQVVIWSGDGSGTVGRAHFWDAGQLTDLGTLGGALTSYQLAINNQGQVTGSSQTAAGTGHAFVWTGGSMMDIHPFAGGGSVGYDINDRGQVTGHGLYLGVQRAFVWDNGTVRDLGNLGGSSTQTQRINELGQVIGQSSTAGAWGESHPFLWTDGQMLDLGGYYANARALNDRGLVGGETYTESFTSVAVLWDNGVMRELPGLGGPYSSVSALNNNGWAVGYSVDLQGNYQAALWVGGDVIQLPGAGGTFAQALDINDRGEIVGSGSDASGGRHAYLWRATAGPPPNQPPVASAGGPYAGAEGTPILFDASASSDPDGDALSHDWDFGDGTTLTDGGPTPPHTYADNRAYTVSLTVRDPGGLSSTASATVTVSNVAPAVSAIAGAEILQGETYLASGNFTDPGADTYTGTVDWGDGSAMPLGLSGGNFDVSHTYSTAGLFTVTVTVTDDDGGSGNSSAQVTVLSPAGGAQALSEQVQDLLAGGEVSSQVASQLLASLEAAAASLAGGNTSAATGQLSAFIKKVEAAVRAGRISQATADDLIAYAQRLLGAIGG